MAGVDRRNDTLDCVRAVLIFAVMAFHYTTRWMPPSFDGNLYNYTANFPELLSLGRFGVEIFFILSGYFISVTISHSRDAFEFAYRRAVRIYPAFVVACTFTFLFIAFFGPSELQVRPWDYLTSLTLTPHRLHGDYVDGAYWSLAVEVKFYILIAVSFLLFRERFPFAMIGVAFVSTIISRYNDSLVRDIFISNKLSFFLLGMSLAFYRSKDFKTSSALALSSVIMYLLYGGDFSAKEHILLSLTAITLCMIVVFEINFSYAPITYLGVISYETYLVHQNIGVSIIGHVKRSFGIGDWPALFSGVAASVLIAAFIHHVAQRPLVLLIKAAYQKWRPGRISSVRIEHLQKQTP